METVLRYELSGDDKGLKKYIKNLDPAATAPDEIFYHVHSDEMTELERWIHGLLSSPNDHTDGFGNPSAG